MLRAILPIFFVTVGCGAAVDPRPIPTPGQGTGTGYCSIVDAKAAFQVKETANSVDVLVNVPGEKRASVRSSVRAMAARHEERRFNQEAPRHREAMPPHATAVVYTDTGARIIYQPLPGTSLPELRDRMRHHIAELPGRCGAHE